MLNDLLAQLDDHVRVSRQFVECPREGGGCGITASQENGYKLIAENISIAGE
jgi:hypothetical protein